MTLENTIRKIINNNAGLLASYSKADGFGAPECQRPRGKFQVAVSNIDILHPDYAQRDMTPADLCPSCASSFSPLCSCLEAYIDFDYYTWNCQSGGGFGNVIEPPLKQLPGHCPSFESLGVAGRITNLSEGSNHPDIFVTTGYRFFIELILGRFPAYSLTSGDQGPNIFGPSILTSRPWHGPTSLAHWQGIFDGTHPLSDTLYRVRPAGQKTMIKMMFDARCGISEVAATGACCIPCPDGGELGGRRCTSQTQTACEAAGGIFKGGECGNPDPCGGCGKEGGMAVKDNPVNQNVMITDLSKGPVSTTQLSTASLSAALIKSLRRKK